jgi:hypothetical protein
MDEILKASEKLFQHLDPASRELLLDAVTGFRDSIGSLSASPSLAKQLENLVKNHISAFVLVVMTALRNDGPKKLFEEIGRKSKSHCPTITESINARFHSDG